MSCPSGQSSCPQGQLIHLQVGSRISPDPGRLNYEAARLRLEEVGAPCPSPRVPEERKKGGLESHCGVICLTPRSPPAMLLGAPGMDLGPLPPHTVRSADEEPLSSSFEALFGLDGVL
eukprot:COSAG06_NODE_323_length_17558_cov_36.451801_9_plen_118_part_00